jgi:hypothetical protein
MKGASFALQMGAGRVVAHVEGPLATLCFGGFLEVS